MCARSFGVRSAACCLRVDLAPELAVCLGGRGLLRLRQHGVDGDHVGLHVVGLMNVQFAVKDEEVYLIEVNPRASRTVPFVAKATDSAIASIAARLMAGEKLSDFSKREPYTNRLAITRNYQKQIQ